MTDQNPTPSPYEPPSGSSGTGGRSASAIAVRLGHARGTGPAASPRRASRIARSRSA